MGHAPRALDAIPSCIERFRVLFVCSRNRWRSPTAERVFSKDPRLAVRSRGLAKSARRTLTAADVQWAQLIAVMEDAHADRLCERFELGSTRLMVLDIPDHYRAMDPELVRMLRDAMVPVLDALTVAGGGGAPRR